MSKIKKYSGVYKITCLINNKTYIGCSNNIYKRWHEHENSLKNNTHHNCRLQNDWNKYNEEDFEFEILEIIDKDNILKREKHWIDYYKSYDEKYGYNILSMSSLYTKIIQLDMNCKIIRIWNNRYEIIDNTNYNIRTIHDCCNHEYNRKTYKNFIWLYYDEYLEKGININTYKNIHSTKNKPIIQLDSDNNFIKKWKSAYEIEKVLNFKYQNISQCCHGKRKRAYNFKWSYLEDYEKSKLICL